MTSLELLKKCIAEIIVEPMVNEEAQPEPYDDETDTFAPCPRDRMEPSKKSKDDVEKADDKKKKSMEKFVKECLSEVIIEPISNKPKPTNLVKECILEVLKDSLTEGGYDPQSQAGPNAPCDNPYPRMNNKMAKMEEDTATPEVSHDAKYYFNQLQDGRESTIVKMRLQGYTWDDIGWKYGLTRERVAKLYNNAISKLRKLSQIESDPDNKYPDPTKFLVQQPAVKEDVATNPHGRYAQEAGAGQFDPRTFGVNEEQSQSKEIQWTCPHCKKPTQIQIEIASPSDYIACSDCVNCGKEIIDPTLNQEVYKLVIGHFAGKPPKVNEGGTWGEIEKDDKSDKPLPNKTTYPSRWD